MLRELITQTTHRLHVATPSDGALGCVLKADPVGASRRSQRQAPRRQDLPRLVEALTPREIEVFDLVTQGCTSPAIAARLKISTRTVESYRVQIMEKMRAESVAVLVRQAIRLSRMTP